MWTLPRSDLKYRLTLRIVAVSAFCFAATSACFLVDADRSARAGIEASAEVTARALALQQSKLHWVTSPRAEFPDLQTIATPLMAPGLCIAYRATGGDILQRVCGGTLSEDADPPALFAAFYRRLFDPGREAVRPVLFQGETLGDAVAWVDPATLTARAWHETSRAPRRDGHHACCCCAAWSMPRWRAPFARRARSAPVSSASPRTTSRPACRPSISRSFPRSAASSTTSPKVSRGRSPSARAHAPADRAPGRRAPASRPRAARRVRPVPRRHPRSRRVRRPDGGAGLPGAAVRMHEHRADCRPYDGDAARRALSLAAARCR